MGLIEHWLVTNEDTGALVAWCEERRARRLIEVYRDANLTMDGPFVRQLAGAVEALREIANPLVSDGDWASHHARKALRAMGVDPTTNRGQ